VKLLVICMLAVVGIAAAFVEGADEPIEVVVESVNVSGIDLDLPDGIEYGEYYPPLDNSTLPDVNDPTSPTTSPYVSMTGSTTERFENITGSAFPGKWGGDVLVWGGEVGTGQDFDSDETTGDIYAVFDSNNATGDTLAVYKSTDGGYTWSQFILGTNTDGAISSPKVVCVIDGSGTHWVILAGIWNESASDILWTRRVQTNGSGATWEQVAADVDYFDLDADVGSGAYAYVTFVPAGTNSDIWAARNAISGAGWVSSQSMFVDPGTPPYPEIAAGAGGTVGIAFIDTRLTTNDEIRIKCSTTYGSSWAGSAQVSNNSGAAELVHTDIAFTHGSTQTGWITATFDFSASNENLGYYYSTNSGSSWTYGGVFSGATDENLCTLGSLKSSEAVTVAFNADPGDMTMYTWTNGSSPTGFITPEQINDHTATDIWRPTAGWIGSYSAVMYCDIGPYNLYLDAFNFTGVEDFFTGIAPATGGIHTNPNPFSGMASISFDITQAGPVTLSVYNIAGQLVTNLVPGQTLASGNHVVQWDGNDLNGSPVAPGVYFCRLTTAGVEETHMMVRTR